MLNSAFNRASLNVAAVITHNPRTVAELQAKYNGKPWFAATTSATSTPAEPKVHILIVPGHEPNFGGAEFSLGSGGRLRERDMAVALAQNLQTFVKNNPRYEVSVTRDDVAWTPDFSDYFKDNWNDIIDWQKSSHEEVRHLIAIGSTTAPTSTVFHNTAPTNVALRLYGITKWANEHTVDIVIHIHFNDYPDHRVSVAGKHSGLAIYVPTYQFSNSSTTRVIAETIFQRLAKYNPVSNLPGESSGIIDEPELIAIGANNTSDAASMLIEYGYIYEPQFTNPQTRDLALKDLAFQTYLGLQDFFDPVSAITLSRPYDTLILPHEWKKGMTAENAVPTDVYALQTALQIEGIYPPTGSEKNDCPRSGTIGACTRKALDVFQQKYGISGEKGVVGSKTLNALNSKYGLSTI